MPLPPEKEINFLRRRTDMNLARFPRRRYADGPTPLQPLERLSRVLGGPKLFIKRDDQLGFAAGGNKVRKLEFVMADALEEGADFIITCGAVQSNHCRLTLAAAVREGLKCGLVLEERVPGSYKPQASGNNFLYRLMGIDRIRVVPGGSDMLGAMNAMADEVRAQGGRPYVIPGGASNPLGALGYAACAQEMLSQAFDAGLRIDRVVCASGSAGTHAGLLTGFWGTRSRIPVVGMNVSRTKAQQEELVFKLTKDAVLCFGDYVGPGYSLPTPGMVEAVKLLARTEAVLLDPVYTGKAMAGLIDQVRKGFFKTGENVVFVHTGGSPALYAYLDSFWE
jgi:D-cysteine desulfhydrase